MVIKHAQNQSLISGIQIDKDTIVLTHHQFDDDTLLFVPYDTEKLMNYKRLLQCFTLMSGLDVNFGKSCLTGCGTNSNWVQEMSVRLGCKAETIPITY